MSKLHGALMVAAEEKMLKKFWVFSIFSIMQKYEIKAFYQNALIFLKESNTLETNLLVGNNQRDQNKIAKSL